MARKYSNSLLKKLQENTNEVCENGTKFIYKSIPDSEEAGALDPRVYKSLRFPMLLMRFMPKKKKSPEETLLGMRKMFNGVKSVPITETVINIKDLFVKYNNVSVPIRIYSPFEGVGHIHECAALPVLYYIHGGGFFAGSYEVVNESNKFFCETYPCIVVSVNYRLAPENPYPAGHNDCYEVLKWIYKNIHEYNGDPEKVFISGDSAGGNLAIYCSLRDREDGTNIVKAEALYYPTVNMLGKEDEYFKPGKHNYNIAPKYEKIVFGMLDMMGSGDQEGVNSLGAVLGTKDVNSYYLSPYWADLKNLPPTILLFGEFDFLYPECKAFSIKLNNANVETKTIIYKGLMHAFLDNIGISPQAEDSVLEVINFVKKYF